MKELLTAANETKNALTLINTNLTKLPKVQQSIMKKILSELYEGLTADLGDDLSKFDAAIQKRLKGIVGSYGQYNNVDDEGSLKSTQNSLKTLLDSSKNLFKPNGLLTAESLKKMKGGSVDPVKEKEREQELDKLRKENEKLKKRKQDSTRWV